MCVLILYFQIAHNALCPTNFAETIVKCSLEYADLPRKFHNNSLCETWGANRVHYGQLENENKHLFYFST